MTKDCYTNEGAHRINMRQKCDKGDFKMKVYCLSMKSQFKEVPPISTTIRFEGITIISTTMPTILAAMTMLLAAVTMLRSRMNYYYQIIDPYLIKDTIGIYMFHLSSMIAITTRDASTQFSIIQLMKCLFQSYFFLWHYSFSFFWFNNINYRRMIIIIYRSIPQNIFFFILQSIL